MIIDPTAPCWTFQLAATSLHIISEFRFTINVSNLQLVRKFRTYCNCVKNLDKLAEKRRESVKRNETKQKIR